MSVSPVISAVTVSSIVKDNCINDIMLLNSYPRLYDGDLRIRGKSTGVINSLMLMLGEKVWFVGIELRNFGNDSLTLFQHIKVVSKIDDRVLFDFSLPKEKLPGEWTITSNYFLPEDWVQVDFTFGRFDFIFDLEIPETDTDITVVFHGFMWIRMGAIILNPNGELFEEYII